jgi:hypothetical protein
MVIIFLNFLQSNDLHYPIARGGSAETPSQLSRISNEAVHALRVGAAICWRWCWLALFREKPSRPLHVFFIFLAKFLGHHLLFLGHAGR